MTADAGATAGRLQSELRERMKKLATTSESRIRNDVEEQRIPFRVQPRELTDFLDRSSDKIISERTFIHYNDLVKWLYTLGYADPLEPTIPGPALQEYEHRELELAEQIQNDLEMRRALRGRRAPPGWESHIPPFSEEEAHLRVKEVLSAALLQVSTLREELATLRSSSDYSNANPRAERSYVKIIAALCQMPKTNPASADATSAIQARFEQLGIPLDDKTIRAVMRSVTATVQDTQR